MQAGPRNLITDVPGLLVGNAEDHKVKTGVTVLTADAPFTAAVNVMGGAPGTRETDLLAPDKMVQQVDALCLAGGSAFGLDAGSGVMDALAEAGRGHAVGPARIPIVPGAILFDLLNGGDKSWGKNPYNKLGREALSAVDEAFELGTSGAGVGATTANLKGGLGSASLRLPNGGIVGALVAVNALGGATVPGHPHFWAAPWEVDDEFGELGPCPNKPDLADTFRTKTASLKANQNTSIAIVATDIAFDQAELTRVATAAQDGMARALAPSHTLADGDLVFAVSTSTRQPDNRLAENAMAGHAVAICLSRAIARGVYEATAAGDDIFPTWKDWSSSVSGMA